MIESIIPDIEETAMLVQEITSSSMEWQSGEQQVNNPIHKLNEVMQQNSVSATMFTDSAKDLSNLADKLKHVVSYFKI